MQVLCEGCQAVLGVESDFCFYATSIADSNTHFITRPERAISLVTMTVHVSVKDKFKRVVCCACTGTIGTVLNFGPNGESFSAISCDRVRISSIDYSTHTQRGKLKWRTFRDKLTSVEVRSPSTFFPQTSSVPVTSPPHPSEDEPVPLVFPSPSSPSYFEYRDLLTSSRVPRRYQVEGFVQALSTDTIICLPTGFGKTLIASMVMARFSKLNPLRVAAMVVDRVPLVMQQAGAIYSDTGLNVLSLFGENKTRLKISNLLDRQHDALVVTAGLLSELVKSGQVSMSLFSVLVFDECHHATGSHKYSYLLSQAAACSPSLRPRLLGLSASPFACDSVSKAQLGRTALEQAFGGARLYRPDESVVAVDTVVEQRLVADESPAFAARISLILTEIVGEINRLFCYEVVEKSFVEKSMWGQVQGQLRASNPESVFREDPSMMRSVRTVLDDAQVLFRVLEISALIGVDDAMDYMRLYASDQRVSQLQSAVGVAGVSKRFEALGNELLRAPSSRVLVFVDSRVAAEALTKKLAIAFPERCPQRVVGHGGAGGMDWKGEGQQAEAIAKLRSGESSLLVCTSVLEEGLDVAACDLVIRLSAVRTSLISFVQSRGRARKVGGKMVMIISHAEARVLGDLEQQERIMSVVLSDCSKLTPDARLLCDAVHADDVQPAPQSDVSTTISGTQSAAIVLFMTALSSSEKNSVEGQLTSVLEDFAQCRVSRIDFDDSGAAVTTGTNRVFDEDDCCVLAGVVGTVEIQSVRALCESWSFHFELKGREEWCWLSASSVYGVKPIAAPDLFPFASAASFPLRSISLGEFKDRQTFVQFVSLEHIHPYFLDLTDTLVIISFALDLDLILSHYTLQIPLASLNSFTLLSQDRRKTHVELYIALSSPPSILSIFRVRRGIREMPELSGLEKHRVMCLHVSREHLDSVLSLMQLLPVPGFVTRVMRVHEDEAVLAPELAQNRPRCGPLFDLVWCLAVLKEDRSLALTTRNWTHLVHAVSEALRSSNCETRDKLAWALGQLRILLAHRSPWIEIESLLQKMQCAASATSFDVPEGYVSLRCAKATPTRVVPLPPICVQTNRLLQRWSSEVIVVVHFVDEQFQSQSDPDLFKRQASLVLHCGFEVSGNVFRNLFAGNSQMRSGKSYFIEGGHILIARIRDSFVLRDTTLSTAKYASRLALFCTAGKNTHFCPPSGSYASISDIANASGEILTDGSGIISRELASTLLGDNVSTSAVQIRQGGRKGVLAVDNVAGKSPNLDILYRFIYRSVLMYSTHYIIASRPSMNKCESDSNELRIVKTAQYTPLHLNREIITLLESLGGIDWDVSTALNDMQESQLSSALAMFTDVNTAMQKLSALLDKTLVTDVVESGFDILSEPMWLSVIRLAYDKTIHSLTSKTRIFIDRGCLLVGVPDNHSCLGPNEVFLRIQRKGDEALMVIVGPVIMYRNPCLHPGDVLSVTAVDRPELWHLVNVLVLSTHKAGLALAAACSGGDLDGDQFAVIYDQRLIPPSALHVAPLDYGSIATGVMEDDPQSTLEDFVCRVYTNNTLGRIAHMHLAFCDSVPQGACDPLAMKMAESQSLAVDYPKTGKPPKIPEDVQRHVLTTGYPDFMRKPASCTYVSIKVLGRLYRDCSRLIFEKPNAHLLNDGIVIDVDLLYPVNLTKPYMEDAKVMFQLYSTEVSVLLDLFSLASDSELLLGDAVHWSGFYSGDKGKAKAALRSCWTALRAKFRHTFFSDLTSEEATLAKASAWYQVAYSPKKSQANGRWRPRHLCFPWLVADVLCKLKNLRKGQLSTTLVQPCSAVFVAIGKSIHSHFTRSMVSLRGLLNTYTLAALQIRSALVEYNRLNFNQEVNVEPFGSFALGLCEQGSDLDVCVTGVDFTQIVEPFERCIVPALSGLALSGRVISNTQNPIYRFRMRTEDGELSVDVSLRSDGLQKARFLQAAYRQHPSVFPVFSTLVSLARALGLMKSAALNDAEALLLSTEMHALIVNLLELNTSATDPAIIDEISSVHNYEDLSESCISAIGRCTILFLERASRLKGKGDWHYRWPHRPEEFIVGTRMDRLAEVCRCAYFALVYTRSWPATLQHLLNHQQNARSICINLPAYASRTLEACPEFYEQKFEMLTGAKVTLSLKAGGGLQLLGNGSIESVRKLRDRVRQLIRTRLSSMGIPRSRAAAYFMEGSTCVYCVDDHRRNMMLKLEYYHGEKNFTHASKALFVPFTVSAGQPDGFSQHHFVSSFKERLHTQLAGLNEPRHSHLRESLYLSVHFGVFYIMNANEYLEAKGGKISVEDLQEAMAKGRRNRKNANRHEEPSSGSHPTVKMTVLSKTGGKQGDCNRKTNAVRQLSSSFYAGLRVSSTSIGSSPVAASTVLCSAEQMRSVLLESGFEFEATDPKSSYKVTVSASPSYTIEVRLDGAFNCVSVAEKPLAWLHCTLLHAGRSPTHQVRIKAETFEPLNKNSEWYKLRAG